MANRNRRTLALALLATGALVWSAIHHFDVAPGAMAWLGLYSTLAVLGIIVLAALSVAALQGFRWLAARWRRGPVEVKPPP